MVGALGRNLVLLAAAEAACERAGVSMRKAKLAMRKAKVLRRRSAGLCACVAETMWMAHRRARTAAPMSVLRWRAWARYGGPLPTVREMTNESVEVCGAIGARTTEPTDLMATD